MKDVLIMLVFGIGLYVFYKIMVKEPILPWKKKTSNVNINLPKTKNKKKEEQEALKEVKLVEELFEDVQNISNHMIRYNDNSFSLIAEVEPVNYFLKSQEEQEAIDTIFESWLASITYPVSIYLQNRYIDISEPIEQMTNSMKDAKDLNDAAFSYGQSLINDLVNWQRSSPRYETKRYIIFTHKIPPSDINAESKEELEEKIVEKTFAELMRRYNAAKSQLRKAEITVSLLPTEGIYELLYYTFNRRRATKLRFKDKVLSEQNALYITADQTNERIEMVKEAIQEYETENGQETSYEKEGEKQESKVS